MMRMFGILGWVILQYGVEKEKASEKLKLIMFVGFSTLERERFSKL